MEVILFQPEIPQNTGNIARTCAVTGTKLTLVRPLGFTLSSKYLKRSGMDYWQEVEVNCVDSLEDALDEGSSFYFFSSKAEKNYSEISFSPTSKLIFGSETSGLPAWVREKWPTRFCTIPMRKEIRCLNLSSSVAIALYEAWRQQGFNFSTSKELENCHPV